ncbi:hypothetical protein [Streptomyces sp.]|nr:hypothetical protein [Streptomyces sp.]
MAGADPRRVEDALAELSGREALRTVPEDKKAGTQEYACTSP